MPRFALILLLFPVLAWSKPNLEISFSLSRIQKSIGNEHLRISVYKDNELLVRCNDVYDLLHMGLYGDVIYLRNIDTGAYRIEYTTILNRTVSETISVVKDSTYWKYIRLDHYEDSLETFKSFLGTLKENESMTFAFESYGCYHWEEQNIKISRVNGKYIATLYPEKLVRNNRSRGKKITKTLSERDIEAFRYYEGYILARSNGGGGSTEYTNYTININGVKWIIEDGDENRKQYFTLRKNIFNVNETRRVTKSY